MVQGLEGCCACLLMAAAAVPALGAVDRLAVAPPAVEDLLAVLETGLEISPPDQPEQTGGVIPDFCAAF